MRWTAIIPFAPAGERKTRLSGMLGPMARDALAEEMLGHVCGVLAQVDEIDRVVLLSDTAISGMDWLDDFGLPLNQALESARLRIDTPLLVLFADLPLLCAQDVRHLLSITDSGAAIAADRHGKGTNAIALGDATPFHFAFGPSSLERHGEQAPDAPIVRNRLGLALDVDTPADLALTGLRDYQSAA
jgi:2-phospho-L-lactate/phosphoenolpyruvate guanylyltransferase